MERSTALYLLMRKRSLSKSSRDGLVTKLGTLKLTNSRLRHRRLRRERAS
jgi:hypothetical protein